MRELQPLQSEALAAAGYDAGRRALLIRFRSGTTYAYLGADAGLLDRLLAAPSKGRFFHAEIDGRYAFERVG